METFILRNFFCRDRRTNICSLTCLVCTFTYDKHMVWLKSLVTRETSWATFHNVSILLATISSFSTVPQHSSKTVILHKCTLNYTEYKTLHYRIHYTNLLVISFSQCNSNAWKLHTPVSPHSYMHCCQAPRHTYHTYIYIPSAHQHVRTPGHWW